MILVCQYLWLPAVSPQFAQLLTDWQTGINNSQHGMQASKQQMLAHSQPGLGQLQLLLRMPACALFSRVDITSLCASASTPAVDLDRCADGQLAAESKLHHQEPDNADHRNKKAIGPNIPPYSQ